MRKVHPNLHLIRTNEGSPKGLTCFRPAGCQIGAPGFEPGTSWSQTRRATGLRHAPLYMSYNNLTALSHTAKSHGGQETVQESSLMPFAP